MVVERKQRFFIKKIQMEGTTSKLFSTAPSYHESRPIWCRVRRSCLSSLSCFVKTRRRDDDKNTEIFRSTAGGILYASLRRTYSTSTVLGTIQRKLVLGHGIFCSLLPGLRQIFAFIKLKRGLEVSGKNTHRRYPPGS